MKSGTLTCITAITLFAALALPVRLAAQEQQQQTAQNLPHYTVTDLGTLGGTFAQAFGINSKGEVVGWSTLPGDTVTHAFLWRHGVMTDLGAFGGTVSVAYAINERSEVAGISEASTPDPLGEDFCGFGDHLICLPVLWHDGVMTPLPTLGGDNGIAFAIDDRGQVVGQAENTIVDPTCPAPQILQFSPVLWAKGEIRGFPTVPGFPIGPASAINDRGQATGTSADCTFSRAHALLWQNGTATDLGSLGGPTPAPAGINNRGQVAGSADLPGAPGAINRAFLWRNGVMQNLGTLPGDVQSYGGVINDSVQLSGQSCDANDNCRGFLWQNGVMTDLNTLVPAGTDYTFPDPAGINSRGEIVGLAVQTSTGELRAFLLTPCGEGDVVCRDDTTSATNQSGPAFVTQPGTTANPPLSDGPGGTLNGLQARRFPGRRTHGIRTTSAPNVTLSPTSLTFAVQLVRTTSAAQTVTLTNSGTAPLSITSITPSADFVETNTCGSSLAAGASCAISVSFRPTRRGSWPGTLSVADNAPGSPQTVSLNGTSTVVEFNPSSLNFMLECEPPPYPCSETKTTTLTNVGGAGLSITDITVSGAPPVRASYRLAQACPAKLGAGQSCQITVTFTPEARGQSNAFVSVTDNGGGSPQRVPLSGFLYIP